MATATLKLVSNFGGQVLTDIHNAGDQVLSRSSAVALDIGFRLKYYVPGIGNQELTSLDKLQVRVSREPENSDKITGVFKKVSDIAGWGTWITQIGLKGFFGFPAFINTDSRAFHNSNYGLIGFPLGATLALKMSISNLKAAERIHDKEGIIYRIADVAASVFSLIGGIFFVLAKFVAKTGLAFGASVIVLPFYTMGYLVDIGKRSYQTHMSRRFGNELKEIIKDENDLNDPKKLDSAFKFLIKGVTVTHAEENAIKTKVNSDPKLKNNPRLKAEKIKTAIDDLVLTKYRNLERRIGVEAAKDFRIFAKDALKDLRSFSQNTAAAKHLIEKVQKGVSAEVRNSILIIIAEIVALITFTAMTILSGGAALPAFVQAMTF